MNANIYRLDDDTDDSNDKNMFTPYVILKKKVKDENGHLHTVKVGVILALAPPSSVGKRLSRR